MRKRIQSRKVAGRRSSFLRRRSAFVFVASLGIWLPRIHGATLVDLDATALSEGPLNTWTNAGTVVGNFTVPTGATVPVVTNTAGVKGIGFLATGGGPGGTHYLGPIAPTEVTGGNPRTIDAWIYNPNGQAEETVFAWGRRGGTPDGSNFSFGHGTSPDFGANALWGPPDIGWNGKMALNRWTYIAYTWDGTTSSVYMDGELVNSEATTPSVNTWEVDNTPAANPLPFRVARQNAADGTVDAAGVGQITIARIRVQDTSLDAAGIKAEFDQEKAFFWADSDSDGMPDWWENQYTPTLNPNVADASQNPDNDGLTNLQEFQNVFPLALGAAIRTNPTVADTDGDGANDGAELARLDGGNPAPTNPLLADTDGDGLADGVETDDGTFNGPNDTGTDPLKADTDGDTFPDQQEVLAGSDPNLATSTPGAIRPALVNLDATVLPLGALSFWTNNGTLGGRFTNSPTIPNLATVQGVKGVTFNGTAHFYTGPAAPAYIAGNSSRSVEAWIMNPAAADEETIFSWGRRGGNPDGSNCSFNHGLNGTFGAVGHWGAPDVAWGPDAASIANNVKRAQWTYVVYVYDSVSGSATVYSNGTLAHSDVAGPLNTWAVDTLGRPLPFRVASQNEANGTATAGLRGSMTIAEIRVFDRVLDAATIQANYNAALDKYGNVDYDSDGLPTWYERQYTFLDERNPADAAMDQDSDGLTNLQEYTNNTLPDNADTDGDGVNDGPEVNRVDPQTAQPAKTNPLIPDTDGDGLTDKVETDTGTFVSASNTGSDPLVPDSDGDSFVDGQEVLYGSNPNLSASVPSFTTPVAVISLDAASLPLGPLNLWTNNGGLGGVFTAQGGDPSVQTVQAAKAVTFDGTVGLYTGPIAPVFLTGAAPRTIDAWVFNPTVQGEEVIFAWGARNTPAPGPNGENWSFGHGNNGGTGLGGGFGAVAMWGGPDIGWADQEDANVWQYCVATYDGTTTRVYLDGVEVNSETVAIITRALSTDGVTPYRFRVARQNSPDGGIDATGAPTLSIAKIRVYDQALSASQITSNYTAEVGLFTRPNIQPINLDPQTGAVTLSWTTVPGQTYAVEASGTLTNWTAVATGLSTNRFSEIPAPAAARYYRIRVE